MEREQVQDLVALAEARSDTKLARLEGKLDLLLSETTATRREAEAARHEASGTKTTIIVTGIATVVALAALLMAVITYGDAIFSRGMSVRDVVKAVAEEQRSKPPSSP